MNILGQSALILCMSSFALAITALSRKLWNKLVLAYALVCSVVSGWAFFFFASELVKTNAWVQSWLNGWFAAVPHYLIHLVFNVLLAPTGLFFIQILFKNEPKLNSWLRRFSYVYAAFVIASIFLKPSFLESLWISEKVFLNLVYFSPSLLSLSCLHLIIIRIFKTGISPEVSVTNSATKLLGIEWSRNVFTSLGIYVGAFALILATTMDHVVWMGEVIPSLANIFLCLYLFVLGEIVIHYRLLNINILVSRIAVFVLVGLIFTALYAVLVAWVRPGLWALFLLNSFLASVLVLILADPMKKIVGFIFQRLFSQKHLQLERLVTNAKASLTGVLDTMSLAVVTQELIKSIINPNAVSIFLLRSDGSKYRRVKGFADEALEHREILSNQPMIELFVKMKKRGETPVLLDTYLQNEIERTTSASQAKPYEDALQSLVSLQGNLAIPFIDVDRIHSSDCVLGFVVIQTGGYESWRIEAQTTSNWGMLTVVYPFFEQAARVLKNMDVYVRLREKDRLAALGQMATGLAHEIRNPLGAIKGAAQYLETFPAVQNELKDFLHVITEEVNRLNRVVTQFLDYSKPLSLELKSESILPILERVYALYRNYDSDFEVVLDSTLDRFRETASNLPLVNCSPDQLQQVIVNLIQNSIQALRRNSKQLSGPKIIRLGAYSSNDGKSVIIFVEDNGPGIPRESLDKVFIPFYTTAHAMLTTGEMNTGGVGLGLAICARIVEAHGGRIDLQSEQEKLTRFSLVLPVSAREDAVVKGPLQ